MSPRNIQTFLPDGTLEGLRIIELSESSIRAFVVPRLKLSNLKEYAEILQPALYLLVNSGENQVYIGESENFFHRIKTHDQAKPFWDTAIAIVSATNTLEKGDVKYLESLAVEKAQQTAAMEVLNKTVPARNVVHVFKVHSLEAILRDIAIIVELLGFSLFKEKEDEATDVWYCVSKKTQAKAQFRGDKFVVLAGSLIDKETAESWRGNWPKSLAEREEIFAKYGKDLGEVIELQENISFKSPNTAGGFLTGRNVNAWTTFKDKEGRTMDEIMRKGGV